MYHIWICDLIRLSHWVYCQSFLIWCFRVDVSDVAASQFGLESVGGILKEKKYK